VGISIAFSNHSRKFVGGQLKPKHWQPWWMYLGFGIQGVALWIVSMSPQFSLLQAPDLAIFHT
jgi:hypothetical protein